MLTGPAFVDCADVYVGLVASVTQPAPTLTDEFLTAFETVAGYFRPQPFNLIIFCRSSCALFHYVTLFAWWKNSTGNALPPPVGVNMNLTT